MSVKLFLILTESLRFVQQLLQANNKAHAKASNYCPFVRNIHYLPMDS